MSDRSPPERSLKEKEISRILRFDNIADRLYHTHLSVNNLPSRGRNFYAQIEVRWNAN